METEKWLLKKALHYFEDICDIRTVGIEYAIVDYLANQESKREALSEEKILKGWSVASLYGHVDRATFISGVRFAEKHHGIGGGDE